jgi:hypothetical protein
LSFKRKLCLWAVKELKKEYSMNKRIIAAIVAVFFAMPVYALAQSTPRIDKRQERQDDRIERGIETGELTRKEARRL